MFSLLLFVCRRVFIQFFDHYSHECVNDSCLFIQFFDHYSHECVNDSCAVTANV